MTLYSSYQDYFKTAAPGATQDWVGGTLTMGDNQNATYIDPMGTIVNFNPNSNLTDIYNSNKFIADSWDQNFIGQTPGTIGQSPTHAPTPNAGSGNTFNVPTNLYPSSSSSGSSGSSQSSQSGINWDNPLNRAILPNLISSGQNLQGNVDKMGENLKDQYANLMRRAFNPNNFQGLLNSLSNRGVIGSSVASDTLSRAQNLASRGIADKAFEANIAQNQAQMQVPGILGQLAALGQESSSSGTSSSSQSSQTSDPLAPYELMARLLAQ